MVIRRRMRIPCRVITRETDQDIDLELDLDQGHLPGRGLHLDIDVTEDIDLTEREDIPIMTEVDRGLDQDQDLQLDLNPVHQIDQRDQ